MIKRLTLLVILFAGITLHAQSGFEGTITFSTSIETYGKKAKKNKATLSAKYGDSLTMFYSDNGNFKRVHKNSSNSGIDFQLYLAEKGILYFMGNNSKLEPLSVARNSLTLIKRKKVANEKIMNLDCECYQYDAISVYRQHVILTYCFSQKTPALLPALYNKHIDFFLYDFYKTTERPYLKFSVQTKSFKITHLAQQLEVKKLEPGLFQL